MKLHSFGAKPTHLSFFSSREAAVRRFAKSLTVLEEPCRDGTLSRDYGGISQFVATLLGEKTCHMPLVVGT